jgi:hypothetical protein
MATNFILRACMAHRIRDSCSPDSVQIECVLVGHAPDLSVPRKRPKLLPSEPKQRVALVLYLHLWCATAPHVCWDRVSSKRANPAGPAELLWPPLGVEPLGRMAWPSKKMAVSGYGRVNPSRLRGSEIEKCMGPSHPGRTRPFRRVFKSFRRLCADQCDYKRSSILPVPICKEH